MTIIDYLISSISALPGTISGAGLFICALLALRAVGYFFSLRWIRAVTNIVYLFIVLLLLARFGQDIASYLGQTAQTAEPPITEAN